VRSGRCFGRRSDDGDGSRAVSALSGERGREIWDGQQWQGPLSVSAGRDLRAEVYAGIGVSGVLARGEAANCRDDAQREWHWGYRARAAGRPDHGAQGIKKKAAALSPVNKGVVAGCCPDTITVEVRRVEAAEVDEMGSFVGSKAHQRWVWHAIDHLTGVVLASVFGNRADAGFWQLQQLLQPFGLVHFYTDAAGVYDHHLPAPAHTVGKLDTQQIERKHLTLRTRIKRLARKTICFSKSVFMPDTVMGLFVNRYAFGTPV
jgi:insertion element IS1 protein InsB